MTSEERSLISNCANGQKTAWDSFVQQYANLVFHTIRKTLAGHDVQPSDEVVKDLFQEFFLALLKDNCKRLCQFRGDNGCTLASWLRVIAARLTIDFLRKPRTDDVALTETLVSDQPEAAEIMISRSEEVLLSQALEALPPRDRLIIHLSCRQNLTPQQIATTLKISVGAVNTRKSRILDKLREILR